MKWANFNGASEPDNISSINGMNGMMWDGKPGTVNGEN